MLNDDVKHLTCYYWKYTGECMHPEDRCLYSHFDTGKDAEEPKRKLLGRPPIAGRNAKSDSPVYNNWRDKRMKVEPEPEEPVPPADVSLLAFVKTRVPKKAATGKAALVLKVATREIPKTAGPRTLKEGDNAQSKGSQGPILPTETAALKTWSQVAGSKPNKAQKPSEPSIAEAQQDQGLTPTPFGAQMDRVDLAVTDLRFSGTSLQHNALFKHFSKVKPAPARNLASDQIRDVTGGEQVNARHDLTQISNVKRQPVGMGNLVSRSSQSIRQEGNEASQLQPDSFTEEDPRTQLFKKRAMYAEVLRVRRAPLRSPQDAVTDTLIGLGLRLLKPNTAPPTLQDLCLIRFKTKQKLPAIALWLQLFRDDCAKLRASQDPMAADYAAWGALRVERGEKVDGPKLRARLVVLDADVVARVRALPSGVFLGGSISARG